MSTNDNRRPSAALRLPGIVLLALLGGGGVYAAHRGERSFSETSYTYPSTSTSKLLSLSSTSADVEIVPVAGRQVRIRWHARWVRDRPAHAVSERDGRLVLGGSCPGGVASVTALFSFHASCSISYQVQVPAGQAILLTADSGDVALRNLRGRISVVAHSGDISATGMRGGADVDLSTDSGDVSASFTRAPELLRAVTSSGDVSVRVPGGTYRISARTDSGDRSISGLTDDQSSARSIVARTSSGDVSIGRSDG